MPPKTILLAEHPCAFRDDLLAALQCCGYTVIQAECARDALDHAEQVGSLDMALIDLELPDVHGMELADILREYFGPSLAVFFISAPDTPEMALLRKVTDIRDIVAAVRNRLRGDIM